MNYGKKTLKKVCISHEYNMHYFEKGLVENNMTPIFSKEQCMLPQMDVSQVWDRIYYGYQDLLIDNMSDNVTVQLVSWFNEEKKDIKMYITGGGSVIMDWYGWCYNEIY
jgi:hypothetical protein